MTTKRQTLTLSLGRRSPLGRLVRLLAHPLALLMAAMSSLPVRADSLPAPMPGGGEAASSYDTPSPAGEGEPDAENALEAVPAPVPAPPPPVITNRRRPDVTPPAPYARFSAEPTAEDIFRARVFGEPLIALGDEPSMEENLALARAIEAFQSVGHVESTEPFEEFLKAHPKSAWRASLLGNLGATYRLANRYTKAESALEEAWQLARAQSGPRAGAVGDKALADLLDLHMMFGKKEPLQRLLAEAEGRDVQGSAAESVEFAQWTVNGLTIAHEKAVPSGPVALCCRPSGSGVF